MLLLFSVMVAEGPLISEKSCLFGFPSMSVVNVYNFFFCVCVSFPFRFELGYGF